jgi:hypothetical protein
LEWLFYLEKSLLKTDLEFKDYCLALIEVEILFLLPEALEGNKRNDCNG